MDIFERVSRSLHRSRRITMTNKIYINGYLPVNSVGEDGDTVLIPAHSDGLLYNRYDHVDGAWEANGTVTDLQTEGE